MSTPPTVFELLQDLRKHGLIRPSTRAAIHAVALFEARADDFERDPESWTAHHRAASLASLLASDPQTWRKIYEQVCKRHGVEPERDPAHAPGKRSAPSPVPALASPRPHRPIEELEQAHAPEPPKSTPEPSRGRGLVAFMRNLGGSTWAMILVALLVLPFVSLILATPKELELPVDAGVTLDAAMSADAGVPVDAGVPIDAAIDAGPVEPEPIEDESKVETNRHISILAADSWPARVAFGLIALAVAAFLFLAIHLASSPIQAKKRATRRKRQAIDHSNDIDRRDAGRIYHIEPFPPFDNTRAMEDAATWLARARRLAPGQHLDPYATVDRSARQAGRLELMFERRRANRPVLVFVDVEKGDHPFHDSVTQLLAHWQKIGIDIERYDYSYQPTSVHRPGDPGRTVSVHWLARTMAESPLIVFSRLTTPEDDKRRLTWLAPLAPFAARVLLELDPRPLAEREPYVREVLADCQESGLAHYPFTERGLLAAARTLATGQAQPMPEDQPLPPLAALEPHISRWANLAAFVPDATWPQLESIRREFLATELDQRAHVQRLIDWARSQQERYKDPEGPNGERLDLPPAVITERKAALRKESKELEQKIREFLCKQLGIKPSKQESPLQKLRRELKAAFHQAVLHPDKIPELEKFLGTAVEPELMALLEEERTLQEKWHAVFKPWPSAEWEAAMSWLEPGARVPARVLLLFHKDPDTRPVSRAHAVARMAALAGAALTGALLAILMLIRPDEIMRPGNADFFPERIRVAPDAGEFDASVPIPDAAVRIPDAWVRVRVPDARPTAPDAAVPDASMPVFDSGVSDARRQGPDASVTLTGIEVPATTKLAGGTFRMGSPDDEDGRYGNEGPVHWVTVSSFEMCRTEITQKQWKTVMGNSPSDCKYGCDESLPVQNISWYDALEYLNRLSVNQNLDPCYKGIENRNVTWKTGCNGYRLPTEAEWEYAARAGSEAPYHFGRDASMLDAYAWYDVNAGNRVHEVGGMRPNGFGLYDMYGNVWEWVWDWMGPYEKANRDAPLVNPQGPNAPNAQYFSITENQWVFSQVRVLRGGSFWGSARKLRAAYRLWDRPMSRVGLWGFRCARGINQR